MKYFRIIVFLPLLMAFQCEDDIEIADDNLNDSGLLGTWEIADETVNGLSDMLPICCEFFEFNPDDNKQDFTGLFVYTDSMGDVYDGLFTVDQTNQKGGRGQSQIAEHTVVSHAQTDARDLLGNKTQTGWMIYSGKKAQGGQRQGQGEGGIEP